jgi:GNAT superfamily N-acetyltransferase
MVREPVIRRATPGDVPAMRAILAAHGEDGPVASGGVDIVGPYLVHVARHHTAMVSELDGRVVAFGGVIDAGVAVMLADLFVDASMLGRGIGRPLLEALFGDAERRATFASDDPRALPLYVRAGMTPLWPSLYLQGSATQLPALDPGLTTWDATPEELSLIEEAWTGALRTADHRYWASQPAVDVFIVEDEEGPVAIGSARAKQVSPARAVERLLVRPGADPVAPTLAALARAARKGLAQACILGPNPVLPVLLDAGWHIVERDQFLASSPDLVDPARLLPNPGML